MPAFSARIRRLAAVERGGALPLALTQLPARPRWRSLFTDSISIPRVLAAGFALLFIVTSVGWLRAAMDRPKPVLRLKLEMSITRDLGPDGKSGSTSTGWLEPGKPSLSYSSDGNTRLGYEGIGSLVEVLKLQPQSAVLRVRLKRFHRPTDEDEVRRVLNNLAAHDITILPGQEIKVPLEGGAPVVFVGSVVRQEQGRLVAVSMDSLLPALNELDLSAPILVRDGNQVVASEPSAAARIDCSQGRHKDCGIGLYGPVYGLLFISTSPLAGAQQGWAGMGQLRFQEEGHTYALYTGRPIAGGEQPRNLWILHRKDYLPSGHGGSKSDDSLSALSSGDLSGILR